jgi:hypothetical protein
LWLAAFRPANVEGGLVCSAQKALAQLAAAHVQKMASDGERQLLADAVTQARGKWLAIELDEIADLWAREAEFWSTLKRALGFLGGKKASSREQRAGRRAAIELSGWNPKASPAKRRAALLGGSHIRDVPWEIAPRKPRKQERHPDRALRDALADGDVATARALIRGGASPNHSDPFGTCWQAVFRGRVPASMLGELMRAGGDIDCKQRIHGPPLVQAAWSRNAAMVRALLRHGARTDVTDVFGRSALAIAARQGDIAIVRLLLTRRPKRRVLEVALREAQKTGARRAIALIEARIAVR